MIARKPTQYKNVTCNDSEDLDLEVNKLLKDNWELLGSCFVAQSTMGHTFTTTTKTFVQTLVKY